jgi:hypothetical protein
MSAYQTATTVDNHGQIHISRLPFQAGTPVDVMVSPRANGAETIGRASRLFAALDAARNSESVGPLNRAELYDRTRAD